MRSSVRHGSVALPDIDPSVALVQAMRNDRGHPAHVWQQRQVSDSTTGNSWSDSGSVSHGPRHWIVALCLLFWLLMADAIGASSQVLACRPLLSIETVRDVRPVSPRPLSWKWHATIVADTSFCATRSGPFEIDFVRIKEYSPDLQFTQRFQWSQDRFEVLMELSPDEAILGFRIGFIAPCVCQDLGQLSNNPHQ